MNQIDRIRAKIKQIETLCAEVMTQLESLEKAQDSQPKKPTKEETTLPTEADCLAEFDRLYQAYLAGNPSAVEEFVREKSKDYLRVFCKVNNLSVDTKRASKERVASEILQWLAQRKAITGGVSSH